MNIILQQVLIADSNSPYNGIRKDILIKDGVIAKIDDAITDESAQLFTSDDIIVSPGWIDIFSHACDPGYEYRETIASLAAAAAAGGFTQVFTLPDTNPVVDNKTQAEYVKQKSANTKINVHPLGAVSKKREGAALAEMYDMKQSGAMAFTDGLQPVQNAGLFLKALQYVKAFDGVVIQLPQDKSINASGLMNEGIVSTRMGLQGIPAIAEELLIARDIELLRYTQSRLHITGITTKKSVELIKAARAEGLNISCSVTPYHLFFCDEDLKNYDTNLKVNPPLRSKSDMMALREAVMNGDIDCIASHHLPQDWDSKTCEFEYAKPGMIGLQTAYSAVQTVLPQLTPLQIASLFSINAGKIFGLQTTIKEGEKASLTLFTKNEFVFAKEKNKSKSFNTPFFDVALKGIVVGVVSKGSLILNN
ncbi:dihydroorotase [Parafilimonas sp.]|uniref:dihydroorotase n=1 Tax=Parafilimonas sp. TaxID=1969739 RepID=UPI0039E67189